MAFFPLYRILNRSVSAAICLTILMSAGCATTGIPPASEWTCDAKADAAVTQGRWEEARSVHEALLLHEPENCLAIYHLGYIMGRLGMRDDEITLYRQALSCGYNRDDQLYFNLGMALGDIGNAEEALAVFKHAVTMNPLNADNHFGMGLMARASGNDAVAERAFLKAISLAPGHIDARLMLARLYLDQSRWEDAGKQLESVLKSEPVNPEASDLWETMATRRREAYTAGDKP